MRYKIIFILLSLFSCAFAQAQETYTLNDTIFNHKIVFSGTPPKYEIAGLTV